MKRSPHPCGQGGAGPGGNPLAAPPYPAAVSHPNPRYASNARHTPASGHAGPLRVPTPLALSRTHTRTRTRPRSHACHPHAPHHHHEVGTPRPTPAFFLALGLLSTCWVLFCLRGGVEGGYNGGDTMRRKQYGKKINIFGV